MIHIPSSTTKKEKKHSPIYNVTLYKELYIVNVNEFFVLIERYPLMQDQESINTPINSLYNCIQSMAKTQFNSLVSTGKNTTYATFQAGV